MSTIVTMSQTVGGLTSGSTYRVRSRKAEALIAASQATKQPVRRISSAQVKVNFQGKE